MKWLRARCRVIPDTILVLDLENCLGPYPGLDAYATPKNNVIGAGNTPSRKLILHWPPTKPMASFTVFVSGINTVKIRAVPVYVCSCFPEVTFVLPLSFWLHPRLPNRVRSFLQPSDRLLATFARNWACYQSFLRFFPFLLFVPEKGRKSP